MEFSGESWALRTLNLVVHAPAAQTFPRCTLKGDVFCVGAQGLRDGQILRTISNMTYSESHYASDEDKGSAEVRCS